MKSDNFSRITIAHCVCPMTIIMMMAMIVVSSSSSSTTSNNFIIVTSLFRWQCCWNCHHIHDDNWSENNYNFLWVFNEVQISQWPSFFVHFISFQKSFWNKTNFITWIIISLFLLVVLEILNYKRYCKS